jgi:genome maintenance exonuclease 1
MYNPKFEYKALNRQNIGGQRLYNTPDGRNLPSVTTILDATKPEEARIALRNWRDRVGHEQAKKITTEAANRGTRMHTYLEGYIKTGVMKDRGSNPYSWASHSMAEKVVECGLKSVNEFWGVEVSLYFPEIYAGTTDCAGVHDGQESILDFKQTNKQKKREWIDDYFLQLAAYAEAHNEVWGTKIRKGVVLMCVKPEVDSVTFKPTSNPIYQEFILEGSEFEKYRSLWWKRVEQYYTTP